MTPRQRYISCRICGSVSELLVSRPAAVAPTWEQWPIRLYRTGLGNTALSWLSVGTTRSECTTHNCQLNITDSHELYKCQMRSTNKFLRVKNPKPCSCEGFIVSYRNVRVPNDGLSSPLLQAVPAAKGRTELSGKFGHLAFSFSSNMKSDKFLNYTISHHTQTKKKWLLCRGAIRGLWLWLWALICRRKCTNLIIVSRGEGDSVLQTQKSTKSLHKRKNTLTACLWSTSVFTAALHVQFLQRSWTSTTSEFQWFTPRGQRKCRVFLLNFQCQMKQNGLHVDSATKGQLGPTWDEICGKIPWLQIRSFWVFFNCSMQQMWAAVAAVLQQVEFTRTLSCLGYIGIKKFFPWVIRCGVRSSVPSYGKKQLGGNCIIFLEKEIVLFFRCWMHRVQNFRE